MIQLSLLIPPWLLNNAEILTWIEIESLIFKYFNIFFLSILQYMIHKTLKVLKKNVKMIQDM